MFFKRSQQPGIPDGTPVRTKAGKSPPLPPGPSRWRPPSCAAWSMPASLGFKTTDELLPITGLIGQERALKAIQFGINIKSHDFNMFVLGPPASGKTTAVRAHLGPKAAESPTPPDWVYVYNFDTPNRPKALKLPHGRAKVLAKGMIAALDELRNVLPARFESDDYQARRRAIDEQFRSGNEEALETLSKKAQSQNIALLRTPTGFAMAPMHEGKVVKPEVFNALPEAMRRDVETKIAALEKELGQVLERLPRSDKKRRGPAQRAQRGRSQDRHPRCA